jgi:hypothetical protein
VSRLMAQSLIRSSNQEMIPDFLRRAISVFHSREIRTSATS